MLDMPAQRLTLDEYVKFVPPSLTHLHLDHGSSTGDNVQSIPWQAFAACPGLSHICLSGPIAQCFLDPSDRDFISLATDQLAALPSNIVIFVLYVDYLPLLNKQIDINSVSSDLETLSAASDRLVAMADRHYRGQIANLHCFLEYRDIGADWGDGGAKDIWEYADICLIKQRRNREAKLARLQFGPLYQLYSHGVLAKSITLELLKRDGSFAHLRPGSGSRVIENGGRADPGFWAAFTT
ncbi:hypothetical protein BDZ89DRAFT_1040075 [Hymenopellis radicata]|nr:hypothetical protein BDZ89DRAFT_1040075 [Hymenopellis radicata]